MNKAYYAIIPANVRYDKDLTANAKLLYGEITALSNEKGYCWATNRYFADLYNVSVTSVSKWVNSLIDKGYIKSTLTYKDGTKEIDERRLTLVTYPIEEKLNTPIEEKFKDNSTYINNTVNSVPLPKNEFLSDNPLLIDLHKSNLALTPEQNITKAFFDLFRNNRIEQGVTSLVQYDKTKLKSWTIHIDRMMRIDGITIQDLQQVYVWLKSEKFKNALFWRTVIFSTEKLRQQMPKLQMAMVSDLKTIESDIQKSKEKTKKQSKLGL